MDNLILYERYNRQEVHDYFVPSGNFTPNAGTWGLHGCVYIPNTSHDYVFFVTYGQTQGNHVFQEGIDKDGILTWQSQPRQHLNEKRVLRWISQNQYNDRIYLFVRDKKGIPYTYFGEINYLSHDNFKEYPVWFQFSLKSWSQNSSNTKFIRTPTKIISDKFTFEKNIKERKSIDEYVKTSLDTHLLNMLIENPHLIDAGEGYRYEVNYEFDTGDLADLVFFGPGREIKIVMFCSDETEIAYMQALKCKLYKFQMCYEKEENENTEFIQCYLITKNNINKNAHDFCSKYDVNILTV
jgi:hypothetical protein